MSAADITTIQEKFASAVLSQKEFRGETTVTVKLDQLHEVLRFCKEQLGYDFLIDISSLDFFGEDPRFMMVYELATVDDKKHLLHGDRQSIENPLAIWLDWGRLGV
jgi:NADH-quinone oxidoreductase subunit C